MRKLTQADIKLGTQFVTDTRDIRKEDIMTIKQVGPICSITGRKTFSYTSPSNLSEDMRAWILDNCYLYKSIVNIPKEGI